MFNKQQSILEGLHSTGITQFGILYESKKKSVKEDKVLDFHEAEAIKSFLDATGITSIPDVDSIVEFENEFNDYFGTPFDELSQQEQEEVLSNVEEILGVDNSNDAEVSEGYHRYYKNSDYTFKQLNQWKKEKLISDKDYNDVVSVIKELSKDKDFKGGYYTGFNGDDLEIVLQFELPDDDKSEEELLKRNKKYKSMDASSDYTNPIFTRINRQGDVIISITQKGANESVVSDTVDSAIKDETTEMNSLDDIPVEEIDNTENITADDIEKEDDKDATSNTQEPKNVVEAAVDEDRWVTMQHTHVLVDDKGGIKNKKLDKAIKDSKRE